MAAKLAAPDLPRELDDREVHMTSGPEPREIDVLAKHGRLHCIVQGEGPPLLFLHGALGTGRAHFRHQINEFASDYQVIVPDFLGYGGSEHRPTFEDFYERDAEDVAALIERLGLSSVNLCGFSDGAVVSMILAGDHPDYFRSLTLIGAQAVLDEKAMEVTRKLAPAESLPEGLQRALARSHGDPYWERLVADYVAGSERLFESGGDLVGDRLDWIRCPTLIVHGEDDEWGGPEHAYLIRDSIQGSELDLFPGVGHEVHREEPETFNNRLYGFLSSLVE